jgi:hypothetical protein
MTAQQIGGADDVMQAQRDIHRISGEIRRIEQEMGINYAGGDISM